MFGKRITLFNLFGFAVRIDLSWILIAVLVTWSLVEGFFPLRHEDLSRATHWWMGVASALGLFGSIIFHELFHSLVARRYDIPIKGITLFIFGGVAEMDREPPNPKAEFMMAIAGPIASLLLAAGFYGLHLLGRGFGWPEPILGVAGYLGLINGLLAAFNLVPGFPLDGGRVLRAVLWGWKKNLRWATRVASRIGSGIGLALIFLGVLEILRGGFVGGLWWFLIGMFLRSASDMSYRQVLMRQAFEGEPVRRFMNPDPVTVAPSLSVEELVEEYVYRYHFKWFPVVEDGRPIGYVSTRQVKEIPREEWGRRTVGELLQPCSPDNTVHPEEDALKALSTMNRTGLSRLMLVEGERLVGLVALKDLLRFLSLKVELEDDEEGISGTEQEGGYPARRVKS